MARNKVTKTCERCGKLCVRNRNRFCSPECHKPQGNKHKDTPCKNCQVGIAKRENEFCSQSCAASYNNALKGYADKVYVCGFCNNQFEPARHGLQKYCNKVCMGLAVREKTNLRIKEKGCNSPGTLRRYLKETRGIQCEICGIVEWCGQPTPLVMDHINGHSEDNSLENLRLICPNCDAQTPTFKSKNKGNGRHRRRQRYAEGKSY